MELTAERSVVKSYSRATKRDLAVSSLMQDNVFDDVPEEIQDEAWIERLEADWQCTASDYSVQYKLMSEHFHPLHANNLAIDLQRLKTVGEYTVVDITRCSYEIHDNQHIRVSVNAKLVFEKKAISGVV